jgi:hypothetical protein
MHLVPRSVAGQQLRQLARAGGNLGGFVADKTLEWDVAAAPSGRGRGLQGTMTWRSSVSQGAAVS